MACNNTALSQRAFSAIVTEPLCLARVRRPYSGFLGLSGCAGNERPRKNVIAQISLEAMAVLKGTASRTSLPKSPRRNRKDVRAL